MVDIPELTADGDQGELNVQAIDDVPAPEDHGEQAAVRTCLPSLLLLHLPGTRLVYCFCYCYLLCSRFTPLQIGVDLLELVREICLCQTPPQGQSQ